MKCLFSIQNGNKRAECLILNTAFPICHHDWNGEVEDLNTSCGVCYRGTLGEYDIGFSSGSISNFNKIAGA